jgi:type VI secretion system secreted protein Hcp
MKSRAFLASVGAVAALAFTTSQALAAYEFYFQVTGVTQGILKGESARERWQDWLVGLAYDYEVSTPRDVDTGRASGVRRHGPVTVTKEWGAATPQIFQALTTNEMLERVEFNFLKTTRNGTEEVYHKVILENAVVTDIKQRTETVENASGKTIVYDTAELEDVSFAFQRITIENLDGMTVATDDWRTR